MNYYKIPDDGSDLDVRGCEAAKDDPALPGLLAAVVDGKTQNTDFENLPESLFIRHKKALLRPENYQ